jgi:FAD/FMN-containing dehydrogenase
VTAIEIVTADGELRRVDADNEPDLFWALRGGGGNFGVVTAIEFALLPISEVYAGAFFFPFERAAEVLHTWNELLPGLPDEITSVGRVMQFPPLPEIPEPVRGHSFAVVEAAYLGTEADGAELLAPLRELRPGMDTFGMVPPVGLSELHMDPPDPMPYDTRTLSLGELPPAGIDELVAVAGPDSGTSLVSVELRHLGGAMALSASHHGALDTVAGQYVMFAIGMAGEPAMDAATQADLARVVDAIAPYEAGCYLNFVEQEFDTSGAFPADAYARLQAVKREYDPDGLFRANHRISG